MAKLIDCMRYVLLIISMILILYPIYAIIKCLENIDALTNYGAGALVGGFILLFAGIFILIFTLRSIKRKKNHE